MGLRINVALHYGDDDQHVVHAQANSRVLRRGQLRCLRDGLDKINGQPTAQLHWLLSQTEISPSSVGYVPLFHIGEPHPDPDTLITVNSSGVVVTECT